MTLPDRTSRSVRSLAPLLLAGALATLAAPAGAQVVQEFRVVNLTGFTASDLHLSFFGGGGAAGLLVVDAPNGCGIPTVTHPGPPWTIDWGAPCVAPGDSVVVRTTSPDELSFASGSWTPGNLPISHLEVTEITTVGLELFDYPPGGLGGASGGVGWANDWWSGANGTDAIVYPGGTCDGVGNEVATNGSDLGSYRALDLSGHGSITVPGGGGGGQDVLGLDETSLWIRLCCQRLGDDLYGGLSLFDQGCCEALFLGSPFGTDEWGLHPYPTGGGTADTVPGSDIDLSTVLVYRVDFLAGSERARLWLDPSNLYPEGPADLDVMVDDFRFNELRLQSGAGPVVSSYRFDGLSLEVEVQVDLTESISVCFGDGGGVPCGCGNDGAPDEGCQNSTGQGAILSASGELSLTNDSFVATVVQATNQPGIFFQGDGVLNPGATFGDGVRCCGMNVVRIGTYLPSGGTTNTSTGNQIGGVGAPITQHPGNAGLQAGDTRCIQYWYRDPSGPCADGFNLTNAVQVAVRF